MSCVSVSLPTASLPASNFSQSAGLVFSIKNKRTTATLQICDMTFTVTPAPGTSTTTPIPITVYYNLSPTIATTNASGFTTNQMVQASSSAGAGSVKLTFTTKPVIPVGQYLNIFCISNNTTINRYSASFISGVDIYASSAFDYGVTYAYSFQTNPTTQNNFAGVMNTAASPNGRMPVFSFSYVPLPSPSPSPSPSPAKSPSPSPSPAKSPSPSPAKSPSPSPSPAKSPSPSPAKSPSPSPKTIISAWHAASTNVIESYFYFYSDNTYGYTWTSGNDWGYGNYTVSGTLSDSTNSVISAQTINITPDSTTTSILLNNINNGVPVTFNKIGILPPNINILDFSDDSKIQIDSVYKFKLPSLKYSLYDTTTNLPSYYDVVQDNITLTGVGANNCGVLSCLSEIVCLNKSFIQNRIIKEPTQKNIYYVILYTGDSSGTVFTQQAVKITNNIPIDSSNNSYNLVTYDTNKFCILWPHIYLKAFVALLGSKASNPYDHWCDDGCPTGPPGYKYYMQYGMDAKGMSIITGKPFQNIYTNKYLFPTTVSTTDKIKALLSNINSNTFLLTYTTNPGSQPNTMSAWAGQDAKTNSLTIPSTTYPGTNYVLSASGYFTLINTTRGINWNIPPGHAWSVLNWDPSMNIVTVRNPWGTTTSKDGITYTGGCHDFTFEEFTILFTNITYVTIT